MTPYLDPRDIADEERSQRVIDAGNEERSILGDELGLFDGIGDNAYRAAQGLSASEAKILLGKRPPAPSPALAFGTLVHTLVLEPEREGDYVVLDAAAIAGTNPKTSRPYDHPQMTAKFKAALAEAEGGGKSVAAQADWDAARAMRDAVHAHKTAASILEMCPRHEVSGWARHETGVLVKGRLDLLGNGIVADLKTTKDADPERFGRTCSDFYYHVSAGNYADIAEAAGERIETVVFVNVEKEPPYRVAVVELATRAVDLGREQMAEACRRLLELGSVQLPSYGDGAHQIDLPPWAYRDGYGDYFEMETPA